MADEIMSNLPRRRPQRATARRSEQRKKSAAAAKKMSAGKVGNATRRPSPAIARKSADHRSPQVPGTELIGQLSTQATRLATEAAGIGLKLAGDVLRRIAPPGSSK